MRARDLCFRLRWGGSSNQPYHPHLPTYHPAVTLVGGRHGSVSVEGLLISDSVENGVVSQT